MLQSDTLANEFNEILNGVEIFAPFQPLDPAITFYAPLRNNVRDLRLNQDVFERVSDAWYKDGNGIYRNVGINRARFEEGRLLMEPAATNKCENYNFSPDPALSNVDISGDATFSRVLDPDSIRQVGLQEIGNDHIFRFDNSASGSQSYASVVGIAGNLNDHAISGWCRQIAGTNPCYMRLSNGNLFIEIPRDGNWHHLKNAGSITGTAIRWQISSGPNCIVDFIGNQLEESPIVTSPIVTEGTAGQRAADLMDWDIALTTVDDAQGMAIFDWQPLFGYETVTASILRGLLGMADDIYKSLAMQRFLSPGGQSQLTNHDGSGHASVEIDGNTGPEAGIRYKVAALWEADVIRQIGYNRGAGWVWGNPVAVTNSWGTAGILRLARQIDRPHRFGEVEIYNENRGTAWIEANYP